MAAGSVASPGADARIGQRVVIVIVGALLLAIYVLHAALPGSPVGLPGPDRQEINRFLPQGWAFFTRSPREPELVVFGLQPDQRWRDITSGRTDRPSDLFGLDRMGRAQGTEIAMLIEAVPKDAWRDCEQEPADCLSSAPLTGTWTNQSSHHSLCGEVGVVLHQVVPWAWRNLSTTMPSKIMRVRVTC